MPTNKLWIEHTERAAWESVEALRGKLAEAEQRVQRLTPPLDGWPAIVAALETTRERYGVGPLEHAEVLRHLLQRLDQNEHRVVELEAELVRLRTAHANARPPLGEAPPALAFRRSDPALDADDDDADDDDEPEGSDEAPIRRFLRAVENGYRAARPSLPARVEALLSAIETEVDELADREESTLPDGAVRLAILAGRLERAARRAARRAPPPLERED